MKSYRFKADLKIIGINPYVSVPDKILKSVFIDAGKERGHIPVKGIINGKEFQQTLVKYSGEWRLYVNMIMLKKSPQHIGEILDFILMYDDSERKIKPHPKFSAALKNNSEAKKVFSSLSPSRQKEIIRYISNLKKEESISKNIDRAISFLLGKQNFAGRKKP
jgi:hypothetical protein